LRDGLGPDRLRLRGLRSNWRVWTIRRRDIDSERLIRLHGVPGFRDERWRSRMLDLSGGQHKRLILFVQIGIVSVTPDNRPSGEQGQGGYTNPHGSVSPSSFNR